MGEEFLGRFARLFKALRAWWFGTAEAEKELGRWEFFWGEEEWASLVHLRPPAAMQREGLKAGLRRDVACFTLHWQDASAFHAFAGCR